MTTSSSPISVKPAEARDAPKSRFPLEPVINFSHHVFVKKCMYIVFTFRHYARDETAAKELSE